METTVFGETNKSGKPCVVSVGVFDGLHLGHARIIAQNVALAHRNGWMSVVMTFSVNPKMAKGSMKALKPLSSMRFFDEMLEKAGVDQHCIIDFSDDMSKLTGEEFVAMLCTSYSVRAMVVGTSFRCGNPSSSAGVSNLEGLLSKYTSSASLVVVPSVFVEGEEVSSSLIRRCLLTGDLDKASRLLGRAYSLDLRNVPYEPSQNRLFYSVRALGQLLPPEGLYMVEATASGALAKCRLCVSEDHLALELPVRMIPDGITFLGE